MTLSASGGAPAIQTLTVKVPSSNPVFSYLITYYDNGVDWLRVNGSPAGSGLNGPATLIVTANPTGLSPGPYIGVINFTIGGDTYAVSVTLTVTGVILPIAAPARLEFAYQRNSKVFPQAQIVSISAEWYFVSTIPDPRWLLPVASYGTGPGILFVEVNPAGLSTGTYQATIMIATPNGIQGLAVTLTVTASPVLQLFPGSINQSLPASSGLSSSAVQLLPSDNSSQPVALSSNTSWITIGGATSNTAPATYETLIDPANLCNGLNSGSLTAMSNAGNSPLTIPVTVLISGASATCEGSMGPISAVSPYGGQSQTMTFTFIDGQGWQHLDLVDILINSALDGRQACYLAYSQPSKVLYLVNDAGTALLPGMTFTGSNSVSNNQCTVSAAGSQVLGSGNTLTLTLNITFGAGFGGNKIIYLAARDLSANNSGWQALGTSTIPGGPASALSAAVNPAGSGSAGVLKFTFTDTNGVQDLGVVDILINNSLDARQACYLSYSRSTNTLYLVNDAGAGLLPALTLGGSGTVSNNQCGVNADGSAVTANSHSITLTLNLTFSASFAGNRVVYLEARDLADANTSGWQPLGTWTVY
jgi:hypothetical protein